MRQTRRRLLLALCCLTGLLPAAGAQILNSERIERVFGSYGIDVVADDGEIRLSRLYSLHDGRKITRTFAMVRLPDEVDPAFAAVHAEIVAGASIGASLQAAGWDVVKTRHQYFRVRLPEVISDSMEIPAGTMLAAHAYRLEITRDGAGFDYALMIEIHHPDYLGEADLVEIFGEEWVIGMPEDTRRLYVEGMDRIIRGDLTLGE